VVEVTKSIAFAYPSSGHAELFKKPQGCYLIDGWENNINLILSGPFDTIKEAEAAAEIGFPRLDWSGMYLRFPLRGSQFFKG
jgi:hypothetical protein